MPSAVAKPKGGKPPTAASLRQQLVDEVFRECMAQDRRTLGELRRAVRVRLEEVDMEAAGHGPLWSPTDHELQIALSRNCMGEGEWDYLPAYTDPPRYVSKARVQELVELAESGRLTEPQRQLLVAMLEDVGNGVRHWKAKHARARAKVVELENLERSITNRAFQGHAGGGLL